MEEEEDAQHNNNNNNTTTTNNNNNNNNETVLEFMDSVDTYLTLFDSLSSTLRQGWMDLASARHSMGAMRISSSLFDLNCHDAATSVNVNLDNGDSEMKQPNFILCKWGSFNKQSSHEDAKLDEDELLQGTSTNSQLRHRGNSEIQEKDHESKGPTLIVEDQIQKERAKSLSMFGTLVSPKLRSSQLSFESALDILVEIANKRSVLLSTYNELQKEMESNRKGQTNS